MSNVSNLLLLIAEGKSLEESARLSGYESCDEAALALRRLARTLPGAEGGEDGSRAPRWAPGEVREAVLYVDGASRGNPGPSSIAAILRLPSGEELYSTARKIGRATNNVAEYRAVLEGIRLAREFGVRELTVRLDSELVMKQLTGAYRIKSPDLAPIAREITGEMPAFARCSFEHVPRGENRDADRLANEALDRIIDP